ncbi:hypothetical protein EYC84_005272 [Monilinia fructicola]|uniref:NAD-dependent epimerase/dehydratase domain-containing protein n=1 Tax=Monilinia fructicola TaxID=38448 RepID=A0A5M9JWX1_MONFR|nr:hypothetical protein EYC84_005272 [Monilinia fructicola]
MHVLLTGGSGFIAAHILDFLLSRGHTVVTTVRSQQKIDAIKAAHPNAHPSQLEFYIVEDIAKDNAFDECIKAVGPGLDAVLHTASPFHFNVTDTKKDLLDPAIKGTTSILYAIKKYGPSVKWVVVTSSFAAIVNPFKGNWPEHTYSEADWNPITLEDAAQNPSNGYRASKTFAEKAAWDFIERERPNFTMTTINPPLVLGPIVHYLNSLDALKPSNQRIRNLLQGRCKRRAPRHGNLPLGRRARSGARPCPSHRGARRGAHKRFFVTAGYFSNREIADEIIRKNFPEYEKGAAGEGCEGGWLPGRAVFTSLIIRGRWISCA